MHSLDELEMNSKKNMVNSMNFLLTLPSSLMYRQANFLDQNEISILINHSLYLLSPISPIYSKTLMHVTKMLLNLSSTYSHIHILTSYEIKILIAYSHSIRNEL